MRRPGVRTELRNAARAKRVWYHSHIKGDYLSKLTQDLPRTLSALHASSFSEAKLDRRSVKDELRQNVICRLQGGERLFPGLIGCQHTRGRQGINPVQGSDNLILR